MPIPLISDEVTKNFNGYMFKTNKTNKIWVDNYTLNCYSLKRDIIYNLSLLKKNSLSYFNQCTDIVTYDEPGQLNRFTVVYVVLSVLYNCRLHLFIQTNEVYNLPSIASLFRSANWCEREIWDLFGIFFSNHPDLRRIILDYGFRGHPLRKDFPITGYLELQFNEQTGMLIYTKIELLQEYKNFNFINVH